MTLYLISYDLIKPEKDYPDLIAALERMGAKRVLLSEWMVRSQKTIREAYDAVFTEGKMGPKDKLLVVIVSTWLASKNIGMTEMGF